MILRKLCSDEYSQWWSLPTANVTHLTFCRNPTFSHRSRAHLFPKSLLFDGKMSSWLMACHQRTAAHISSPGRSRWAEENLGMSPRFLKSGDIYLDVGEPQVVLMQRGHVDAAQQTQSDRNRQANRCPDYWTPRPITCRNTKDTTETFYRKKLQELTVW